MKNKIIILTVFACLLLSACSDYLDRKPYTQPNNEDFLKTRENVESYINSQDNYFIFHDSVPL